MSTFKSENKRHIPLPRGPYTVGCIDLMTEYSDRNSFIRLYYPCAETGITEHIDRWPKWADKEYLDGYTNRYPLAKFILKKIFYRICENIYIPAIMDATPLFKENPFPVIVFSHGLCACRLTYSAIHLELASNGYVIASVEHRDRSACYTFCIKESKTSKSNSDSRINISNIDENTKDIENECNDIENNISLLIKERICESEFTDKHHIKFGLRSISRRHAAFRNEQVHQRMEECIATLNILEDVNNGIQIRNLIKSNCFLGNFCGLFDMSRTCIAGHSFGGATVLKTLSVEKRFKIGIALDAWTIPIAMETELASSISQPILFIKSHYAYTRKTLQELHQFHSNEVERKFVTIKKTIHMNQCDLPFVVPKVLLMFCGEIFQGNPLSHMILMSRLIMVFLSKHLDLNINENFEDYIRRKSSHIKEKVKI